MKVTSFGVSRDSKSMIVRQRAGDATGLDWCCGGDERLRKWVAAASRLGWRRRGGSSDAPRIGSSEATGSWSRGCRRGRHGGAEAEMRRLGWRRVLQVEARRSRDGGAAADPGSAGVGLQAERSGSSRAKVGSAPAWWRAAAGLAGSSRDGGGGSASQLGRGRLLGTAFRGQRLGRQTAAPPLPSSTRSGLFEQRRRRLRGLLVLRRAEQRRSATRAVRDAGSEAQARRGGGSASLGLELPLLSLPISLFPPHFFRSCASFPPFCSC